MNHIKKAFLFLIGLAVFACQNKPSTETSKDYLFKVDESPVFSDEFLYAYTKNNFNKDSVDVRKDMTEYLDLFMKFKLKVREGKAMGLDTTEAFINELEGYRKQLSKPYLTDKSITEAIVKEAYDRLHWEVEASHILLDVPENASPQDTLEVYNEILKIRNEIIAGADFAEAAKKYSNDPSAQQNGGKLGYFSAFQMVYPFESAAFNTEVGEISQPAKTRFGYHILKVINKRPAQGRAKVSHIMVRATEGMPVQDSLNAIKKINEIYARVKNSEDWNLICSQFSDDFNTKTKGGSLPWFESGSMIPSFAEASFALAEKGDISKPIQTPYGWHVIKLEDKENIKSLEEEREGIEQRISRDSRSGLSKTLFLKRLKKEHNYIENAENLEKYLSADTVSDKTSLVLFNLGNKDYTAEDFQNHKSVSSRIKPKNIAKEVMMNDFNRYVDDVVMTVEEDGLSAKYPEYGLLLNEYHEGIMLFELMDDKVWSKAVKDSTGLANYFNANLNNYQWKKRANAIIYDGKNQNVIDSIKTILISGDSLAKTKKSLEEQFNQISPLTLQIRDGQMEIEEDEVLSKIENLNKGSYNTKINDRFYHVVVSDILEPQTKKLNEAKGAVISNYQEFLEKQWIDTLKAKYKTEINKRELEKLIKRFENK